MGRIEWRVPLALLMIVALALTGCRGGGEKPTTVAEFNQTHSDIKVNATYQGGYADIMAKVWSAVYAKQTLPHVAHLGAAPLLGDTGAIVPITDFTDGPNGIDRSLIRDSFWDYNSAQGQLWSMPFNNSVPLLYYR